jgi:hypothetical protein
VSLLCANSGTCTVGKTERYSPKSLGPVHPLILQTRSDRESQGQPKYIAVMTHTSFLLLLRTLPTTPGRISMEICLDTSGAPLAWLCSWRVRDACNLRYSGHMHTDLVSKRCPCGSDCSSVPPRRPFVQPAFRTARSPSFGRVLKILADLGITSGAAPNRQCRPPSQMRAAQPNSSSRSRSCGHVRNCGRRAPMRPYSSDV